MQKPAAILEDPARNRSSTNLGRCAIRIFFGVAVTAIGLDIIPPTWPLCAGPKHWLSNGLYRLGLWQGQWSMFTPNPVIHNANLSAEFEDFDGNLTYWDSPDWKRVSNFEKFYGFRHLNFYNRIQVDHNHLALNDFADYLTRNESKSPVQRVKLFRHSMSMVVPEDGRLPSRQDTIWVYRSDFLTERHYDP